MATPKKKLTEAEKSKKKDDAVRSRDTSSPYHPDNPAYQTTMASAYDASSSSSDAGIGGGISSAFDAGSSACDSGGGCDGGGGGGGD